MKICSQLSNGRTSGKLTTELERVSHIIFSSNEKQKLFWLGKGKASKQELTAKWGGCKPCLHGSDAHDAEAVGKPALDRFSWIKGDLSFETLRQACIEPEIRAFVGNMYPSTGMPSYTIEKIGIANAEWLPVKTIPLNAGLTAIIGARGSGKTALADLIATAGNSSMPKYNDRSFIRRAESLINRETVKLTWQDGDETSIQLKDYIYSDDDHYQSKVQYLSQQFVDQLCSAEGPTDELMEAIERVIFEAHNAENRMGATSFSDLMDLKLESVVSMRSTFENEIESYTSEINSWREKKSKISSLEKLLDEKGKTIEKDKRDRQNLVGKGTEDRVKLHQKISAALDSSQVTLDAATRRHTALNALSDSAESMITSTLPNSLRSLKEKHSNAGLTDAQWENFRLGFKGDVKAVLKDEIAKAKATIEKIKGKEIKPGTSFNLEDIADISADSYNTLVAKQNYLQKLVGIDKENSIKFKKLSEKIAKDDAHFTATQKEIAEYSKSDEKVSSLLKLRSKAYEKVFDTLLKHESILSELYQPLKADLSQEKGALGKLTFHVRRKADIERWTTEGEALMDLRKAAPFKGKGTLLEIVKSELLPAWEKGSAQEVSLAMTSFLDKYRKSIDEHCLVDKTDRVAYREWSNRIAEWLFSTSHISIKNGIQYDGVDIHQLSSGTRGIVLLLLYLTIDKDDYRPLIIDQPEENLDPKSIFDELVPRFREAKIRRQILIVTHNANLVVNTDADQVIVASCGDHRSNSLPIITYDSGGLENNEIRQQVCEILEGGEAAFKERAKRLRVHL